MPENLYTERCLVFLEYIGGVALHYELAVNSSLINKNVESTVNKRKM